MSLSFDFSSTLGSGASKNFSRIELSSQLKISLTVNGNLNLVNASALKLLVPYVMTGVFVRHHRNVVNQLLHFVMVKAA